ncbi:MAG: rhodanese-like domain-containing protein [Bacteroidetes bacterium]|nr:rhodanese-like domain-containing protein [Bacteroidota bacterium]
MKSVSVQELQAWKKAEKKYLLLDVREASERERFGIGGRHLPLGELINQAASLPREIPIVLYCEKGIRSQIALQRLEALGFDKLFNLEGGMKAWKNQIADNRE